MKAEKGSAPRRKTSRSKDLRVGFSTGTAVSAGAKAALMLVLGDEAPDRVEVDLPGGQKLEIKISGVGRVSDNAAWAQVIKDGGDDPDVTHKALIRTEVFLDQNPDQTEPVIFEAGPGVGRVTKPGLQVEVGQPAINPVPRKMIRQALEQVWEEARPEQEIRARVRVSVDQGEKLARHTLNPRLGIVGGISILGTHGLVKPFSHDAYTATIDSSLSMLKAVGITEVVLTTGGKSEKRAMALRPDLEPAAFVQIADFFAYALQRCGEQGLERVTLVSFLGKAIKQASGLEYTHARQKPMDFVRLAGWFGEAGAEQGLTDQVKGANTARQVMDILKQYNRVGLVSQVGKRMLVRVMELAAPIKEVEAVIIGFEGGVLFRERAGRQE